MCFLSPKLPRVGTVYNILRQRKRSEEQQRRGKEMCPKTHFRANSNGKYFRINIRHTIGVCGQTKTKNN